LCGWWGYSDANKPFVVWGAGEGDSRRREKGMAQSSQARGVVFLHSSPRALCAHIEWALGGLLGVPVNLDWVEQPVAPGALRSELSWQGKAGLSAQMASALHSFPNIRFEITEEPSAGFDGQRYVSTPSLGLLRTNMGVFGESLIPEEKIRTAVSTATTQGKSLIEVIDESIGGPWDRELEPFRFAGEGTPVRWLTQVG